MGNEKQLHTKNKLKSKVRALTVITCLCILLTLITVLASVFICLHYKHQGKSMVTFSEAENQSESETTAVAEPVLSNNVFTEEEVDNLLNVARLEALQNADAQILTTLQDRLVQGDSPVSIYRDLYPNHVVFYDSGQYHFIEKSNELKPNVYLEDAFFKDEKGFLSYEEEGIVTYKGIDVSRYQGEIDWEKVKNDGVDYAIIRVGIRGYSEGAIIEDERFLENIENAQSQGVKVGVYFFTEAINETEALEEAEFVLEKIKDYQITYPVYLDVEDVKSAGCRTNNLTMEERTTLAKIFLDKVAEAGYTPGIYGNLRSYMLMLDLTQLEEYDKWFASYSLPIYYPYDFQMLQYGEDGKIAGIKEKVDVNISFRDYGGETQ